MPIVSGYVKTKDHIRIHYEHCQAGYDDVVIIAHGFFNSKQSSLLKELSEDLSLKYDILSFDFRGHGKSQGLFHWTSKEYLDLLAVIDYAKKRYTKIGVIGFSLGAATSLITASKTDCVHSLISISSPSEFEKIDYRFWELSLENDLWYGFLGRGKKGKGVRPGPFWQEKEKPVDVVERLRLPILFIHGNEDWVIKHAHSKKLYEKTKTFKKLAIIKNGPHAEYLIRKNKKELMELIHSWFKETLL